MAKLPSFSTYGNYASSNYGVHAMVFTDPDGNRFWFSYQTLVAFCGGGERVVLQNYWGPTTGKHLNAIDGGSKKQRVDHATFERRFQEQFGKPMADVVAA